MTGDYPFEVVDGGRVISAASEKHAFTVAGRPRLWIRNQEYFLNQLVQPDGGREFEWQAPGLGKLVLRARETCTVVISGRPLGEPPIERTMAAGSYTADVTCDGQTKHQPFSISAGTTNPVTVK